MFTRRLPTGEPVSRYTVLHPVFRTMNNESAYFTTSQSPIIPKKSKCFKRRVLDKLEDGEFRQSWRSLVAYWILGLCNNYGYVVMLTAANDIVEQQAGETPSSSNSTDNPERDCNYMSTGAILLADIVPSLVVKIMAPFLPFFVNIRVASCVFLSSGGFLLVAFSSSQWMSIAGVVVTSLSSGLGEVTFLQYTTNYHKNVVSTWSSGTGGAGVIGAFSYAVLNVLGLRNALLVMLVVPALMAISFWVILTKPTKQSEDSEEMKQKAKASQLTFAMKVRLLPKLLKYMIPLGLVYLFEYFINQGMFELINFENTFIDKDQQYRWLQVDYQIGVFLSRSSVNIIHLKRIWLMAVLQFINVVLYTTEAIFYYIPYFWIVLVLTLWEGLLGGAAYVNTFYKMSIEIPEDRKEFSMAITSFSDTIGITFAGIFAIVAHNQICALPKPIRLSF